MKSRMLLIALCASSLGGSAFAMEEKVSNEDLNGIVITPPNLSYWDGVSEIEGWTKQVTRPRPAGQWHPARLWILSSTSDHPENPIQAVYWTINPENQDGSVITASFGINTIDGKKITFEGCSFKGDEGTPGESEKYINNHYDEPHTNRPNTTGKQFSVWGSKKEYPKRPRETLDAFPASATVIFKLTSHTGE